CVDERQLLKDIEKLIKRTIEQEVIPGFEPDPNAKPEPIQQRRGQGNAGRQPRTGEQPKHNARSQGGQQASRPTAARREGQSGAENTAKAPAQQPKAPQSRGAAQ